MDHKRERPCAALNAWEARGISFVSGGAIGRRPGQRQKVEVEFPGLVSARILRKRGAQATEKQHDARYAENEEPQHDGPIFRDSDTPDLFRTEQEQIIRYPFRAAREE